MIETLALRPKAQVFKQGLFYRFEICSLGKSQAISKAFISQHSAMKALKKSLRAIK